LLGLPVVETKDASWVLELADVPRRQHTQLIRLEVSLLCGLHFVEFDSGARQRLGSGFDGGDERIVEGFEEDE
jgi:hypothetical protein